MTTELSPTAALQTAIPTDKEGILTMTSVLSSDVSPREGATLSFTTRFGQVELREDRLISFPQGVFGFRECTQFGLARMPNLENSPLMLMQCVDQPSIAFLVADPHNLGLELTNADRVEALEATRFSQTDTQFLAILTLYDQGESFYLTANLKAPVLIDSASRTGAQFILSNKDYSTQQKV